MPRFQGLVAATYTPFDAQGALNLKAVERQAAHLAAQNVAAVFVGGTTGESHSLSVAERLALAERWLEAARGSSLRIVVHVGANCLADAQILAAAAQKNGAHAIAAVAPSYFKPRTIDALAQCLAEITGAAPDTPFYYYDIPSMTGLNLPVADLFNRAASGLPTLVGLKFSNPDLLTFQLCLRAAEGRFEVLWGYDEYLLAALALGGRAAVGSSYNFAAPIYHRLLRAFSAGNLAAARDEQFRGAQIIQCLAGHPCGFIGASKALMSLLGVDVGPARLPQASLTPEQIRALRAELETLGFFDWIR